MKKLFSIFYHLERVVDDVIAESKLNIITVNTCLTMMEMKNGG